MSRTDPGSDTIFDGEPGHQNLPVLALLYATGELDAAEAAAFERRLGEDQSAREALCQAVQLAQAMAGLETPLPRLAYRERVRQELRGRSSWWSGLLGRRVYRGHPALWSLVGAAAAVLVLVLAGQSVILPFGAGPQTAHETLPEVAPVEPSPAEAQLWADLHSPEHLEKARAEEQRRKQRAEDRRLAREDRSPRYHAPTDRH
jgi:anti-sigma-K factor RskA